MIVYDEDGNRVTGATYALFIGMCLDAKAEGDCYVEVGGQPLLPVELGESLAQIGVPLVFNPEAPTGARIYSGAPE